MSVSTTNNYWNILKHLSDDTKIELIALLSDSLRKKPTDVSVSATDFYGILGNDGIDDDEFVKELREARRFNHEIVEI